jgi:hypothetical protein
MKFRVLILSLGLFINVGFFHPDSVQASCETAYAHKLAELAGKMNPPRTTAFVNLGAEAVLVTTLAAAGTLSLGAVVALPAAALGAAGYLAVLGVQKKSYEKAAFALRQAERGQGKHFKRLVTRVKKKVRDANTDEIRHALLRLNIENAFCSEDLETGKISLSKFKHMSRLVAEEIL